MRRSPVHRGVLRASPTEVQSQACSGARLRCWRLASATSSTARRRLAAQPRRAAGRRVRAPERRPCPARALMHSLSTLRRRHYIFMTAQDSRLGGMPGSSTIIRSMCQRVRVQGRWSTGSGLWHNGTLSVGIGWRQQPHKVVARLTGGPVVVGLFPVRVIQLPRRRTRAALQASAARFSTWHTRTVCRVSEKGLPETVLTNNVVGFFIPLQRSNVPRWGRRGAAAGR